MINKDDLQAEPLFVSLKGQSKEDERWILFDHFQIENGKLFLIGLDLENNPMRMSHDAVVFSPEQLEYTTAFIESQLTGMQKAFQALQFLTNTK